MPKRRTPWYEKTGPLTIILLLTFALIILASWQPVRGAFATLLDNAFNVAIGIGDQRAFATFWASILGFTGVAITLMANASFARRSENERIERRVNAVASALSAELKSISQLSERKRERIESARKTIWKKNKRLEYLNGEATDFFRFRGVFVRRIVYEEHAEDICQFEKGVVYRIVSLYSFIDQIELFAKRETPTYGDMWSLSRSCEIIASASYNLSLCLDEISDGSTYTVAPNDAETGLFKTSPFDNPQATG